MKPIILKNHFDGKDTIILKDHIMNGCEFWDMSDKRLTNSILDKHKVSKDKWKEVLYAVWTGEGDADNSDDLLEFAIRYNRDVDYNDYLRELVLKSKDPQWAWSWCNHVSDSVDMRQIIIDAKDPRWAFNYCRDVSDDEDMRQVIVDSGSLEWASSYFYSIRDDHSMRQVVLDANNPSWACYWCSEIDCEDEAMRQIVLESKDPELAYQWCNEISNDDDMRNIVLNSNDPELIKRYFKDVEDYEETA